MPLTFTDKFRLPKPEKGTLDWHPHYYNAMGILDVHVPRIFMVPPKITAIVLSAGGSLTPGHYYFYKVMVYKDADATNTLASYEMNFKLADVVNKTITIGWSGITGTTKYKVYRYDTTDSSYEPLDTDYLWYRDITAPTTTFIDDGTYPAPSGVMPLTTNWYVTEIEQLYIKADTIQLDTFHTPPTNIIENLNNVRSILKQIKGVATWDTTPPTSLYEIINGKSGGQTFTGGTLASENLTLKSTSHATKGYIYLDSTVILNGFTLNGDSIASGNLTLDSTSHATKGIVKINPSGGTVYIRKNTGIVLAINIAGDIYIDNNILANNGVSNLGDITHRFANIYLSSNINYSGTLTFNTDKATLDTSGNFTSRTLISNVAEGTAPLTITSITKVNNLNVDLVDGVNISSLTSGRLLRYNSTGTQIENATVSESAGALSGITTLGMSGQLTNTLAIGTAPLVIISTTKVINLNVDKVDGVDIPGTILAILTDHNKANHDSLNINADTVDTKHYSDVEEMALIYAIIFG